MILRNKEGMRLSRDELEAIREKLQKLFPDGRGFLFGSRTDDNRRGETSTFWCSPLNRRRISSVVLSCWSLRIVWVNKGSTCSSHTAGTAFRPADSPKLCSLMSQAELLRMLAECLKQVEVAWVALEHFRRRCEEIGVGPVRFGSIDSCH